MSCKRCLVLAGLALLALPWGTAQAGGPRFGVGVYVGGPYYYGYGPYWGGYYYYPPVYAAPRPVVVVQAAPPVETIPGPIISTTPVPPGSSVAVPTEVPPPPRAIETRLDEIDRLLGQLSNPDDKVRADVAIRLGRMKARRAAEPLEHVLASDRSPEVRDAAARGLGLIGAPASIAALQHAAQSDEDRGVRNSAQFAVEVIRSR